MKSGFVSEGFGVLRKWLADADVASARTALEVPTMRAPDPCCTRPANSLYPLRWCDAPVRNLLERDDCMHAVAALTGGCDLRWISAYLSVKDPYAHATEWHQDWWCWNHPATHSRRPLQVAVLCYLHDTDVDQGALRVLPGSHHRAFTVAERVKRVMPGDVDRRLGAVVTIEGRAGDALVVDYRLLHGARPNRSARPRWCLILNFAPDWRELPTDIRGHLIQAIGQPTSEEWSGVPAAVRVVLPHFDGARVDLPLSRTPTRPCLTAP